MSNRFKTSKYKNCIPHLHKKESWINDLRVGSNLTANGDNIKASCTYVAFIHDSSSIGTVAVLPINAKGRFTSFPLVTGHAGSVTDFCFSPFNDQLLATGSEDCMVKLWQLPGQNVLQNDLRLTDSIMNFGPYEARVENLLFHPSANKVLAVSFGNSVKIFDLEHQLKYIELDRHENIVESLSWHGHGQLFSTLSKCGNEKVIKIFDPRAGKTCSMSVKYHNGQRPSKISFLSDTNFLVTAGFNKMREAELILWDTSDFSKPLTRQSLGTYSSGNPILLFDGDSKLLFFAMKGENTISQFDCSVSLVPGQRCHGSEIIKGLAMIPKRGVDVMSCEIVRLLQLTQSAVIPISYHVQRKSYSDFHADLFPDTPGNVPAMTAEQWYDGANTKLAYMSLDPKRQQQKEEKQKTKDMLVEPIVTKQQPDQIHHNIGGHSKVSTSNKCFNVVRSSKFRHIEGKFRHRSTFINRIPALNSTVPGDSNAFQVNRDYAATVLSGAGGQLGVFKLSPGCLDSSNVPTLQNGSSVVDFAFDPFNTSRIVVACEDAKLRLWTLPPGGLSESLTEPEYLLGHQDKANILHFHPQAKSLLASAGYDRRLLLWDLSTLNVALSLTGLSAPLFCMAWSPDGTKLATFSKDHVLRIFDPRSKLSSIVEGRGPEGNRGARLVWLDNSVIAVSCFNKSSARTITLYSTDNLDAPLSEIATAVSPATLVPFFDVDTNLLFLTGKGDSQILAYEYVKSDSPYLFSVAPFNCGSPHQGVSYLPKVLCDVTKVEIASGMRLTKSAVEGFAFQVPRTRLTYFQDDLYPDTLCVEEPSLSAQQWLQGENAFQTTCSMKPATMKPLSEAPKEAPAAKKFISYNPEYKTEEQKKEELLSAMIDRMGEKEEEPLPQQGMDGVDSDEWSD